MSDPTEKAVETMHMHASVMRFRSIKALRGTKERSSARTIALKGIEKDILARNAALSSWDYTTDQDPFFAEWAAAWEEADKYISLYTSYEECMLTLSKDLAKKENINQVEPNQGRPWNWFANNSYFEQIDGVCERPSSSYLRKVEMVFVPLELFRDKDENRKVYFNIAEHGTTWIDWHRFFFGVRCLFAHGQNSMTFKFSLTDYVLKKVEQSCKLWAEECSVEALDVDEAFLRKRKGQFCDDVVAMISCVRVYKLKHKMVLPKKSELSYFIQYWGAEVFKALLKSFEKLRDAFR